MKAEKITVTYSTDRLQAIRVFSADNPINIEKELTEYLDKLYKRIVPQAAKLLIEYNEKNEKDEEPAKKEKTVRPESKAGI